MIITVQCGDCLDESNYPDEPADLILFDPPFKPFKKAYKQVRKNTVAKLDPILTPSAELYDRWWRKVCEVATKYLKPTGWFCYKSDSWTAKGTFPITREFFDYSNEVILDHGDDRYIMELGTIVWDKGRIGLGRKIRTQHEQVEVYMAQGSEAKYWKFGKGIRSSKREQIGLTGKVGGYKIKKWHGSSQNIAFPSIIRVPNYNNGTLGATKTKHINETPKKVWEKFIDYMCPPKGLVLDLTAGLGSVGKEVKYLNSKSKDVDRDVWLIEIEYKYCIKAYNALNPNNALTGLIS
jgi:DNA modification methylase